MKNSQKYHMAMVAVIDCFHIGVEDKIKVLELLMDQKSVAEYVERKEEEAKA